MLYCCCNMVRNRCNYFSFWAIFCFFIPLTAQKIKILWKWKKHLEISLIYTSVPKIMIICCTVPEIWCVRCTYFSFWATFCPFTHPTAQKIKILQKLKKHLNISSLYIYVPKTMIRWCKVPEIWCATDRQKKWHTEVGDPPKKRGLKVYPSKKWKPYNWEVLALKES